eukprot:896926-Amphidinium_carterae.1
MDAIETLDSSHQRRMCKVTPSTSLCPLFSHIVPQKTQVAILWSLSATHTSSHSALSIQGAYLSHQQPQASG